MLTSKRVDWLTASGCPRRDLEVLDVGSEGLLLVFGQWPVAAVEAEGGCALEDRQMFGLLGDLRNYLHTRRSGADDTYPFAREVESVTRPRAGVDRLTLVGVQTREIRCRRRRKASGRGDQVLRRDVFTGVGADRPTRCVLVPHR